MRNSDVHVLKDLSFSHIMMTVLERKRVHLRHQLVDVGTKAPIILEEQPGIIETYKDVLPAQFHVNHFSDHVFDVIASSFISCMITVLSERCCTRRRSNTV